MSSSDEISLTMFILYLSRLLITLELRVSIEIGISDISLIDSTTGTIFSICCLLGTGSEPGFGKTLDHNYIILNQLNKFSQLQCKVLSGISRKSMIGTVIDKPASERLYGSLAATVLAIRNGANILRVHDVRETRMLLQFRDLIEDKS